MAHHSGPDLPQGYEQSPHARLADLCMPKAAEDGNTWFAIEDEAFYEISDLLLNIGHKESWSRRPRTYAVLKMMNAVPYMDAFETYGLNDTSFPYRTKRDLPPELQTVDMSDLFFRCQNYVLCDACDLEKDKEVKHISVKNGDKLFKWHKKLGKGQSGDVDKVESLMTGKVYARKRIKRHREMRKEKEAFKRFETELAALKRLNHEHLVRVHGSYTDNKYVALLMSPVADCNLKLFLQGPIKKEEMSVFRGWYGCLANAIAYLKDMEIRHKDIKPENILVKGKTVFLSDFGTAWDWSDSKFADSVTKGQLEDFTPRYASPEVMTTGSKSRRSSSDVWSLGIVFLEMTTILRGKSLKDYENYLARNGSRSGYPSENWVSVNSWLEQLIPYYPRTDNEPLQWIKEMIKIDPTTRPKARDLSAQIGQAMNGVWCGRCCNDEDSTESITTSEYESQHGDLPDLLDETNDRTVVQQPQGGPLGAFNSLTIGKMTNEPPPTGETPSIMEVGLAPGETIGERMMTNFLHSLDHADIPSSADIQAEVPNTLKSIKPVLPPSGSRMRRSGTGGLFGKVKELLASNRDSDPLPRGEGVRLGNDPLYRLSEVPGSWREEDQSGGRAQEPLPTPVATAAPDFPDPSDSPGANAKLQLQQADRNAGLQQVSKSDAIPVLLSVHDRLQKLADRHDIPGMILDTWKSWAQPLKQKDCSDSNDVEHIGLVRTRSYEHIGRQVESILESQILGHRDLDRRASDDFALPEYNNIGLVELDNIKKELKEFKPKVSLYPKTGQDPPAILSITPKVSLETVEEVHVPREVPKDSSVMIEEIFPSEEPPPAYSPARIDTSYAFTSNSLKDSLNQVRGKAPIPAPPRATSLLTAKNLSSLNAGPPKPKRVRVNLQTASVYMKRIHDDAASSVATSVMSTRTRERFKLAGLMLPLQDRSCHYLEQYCREGKADAVRLLLRSGCEPGTVNRRRPGPIFNAVRGASIRHLKCVDALISSGVNVNVRSKANGRTPLHYAIEHLAWPGYMRLIYTLLKAGADPNIKDATGDVPLLQILYGGVETLPEHKRDALAILLTSNFNTDLGVSPPATKNTPLHLAVMHQDPWAVALLLDREVAVNKKNVAELTPLQLAAGSWSNPLSEDQMAILELLLEKNAKVNVKDEGTGQSPVHTAVLLELDQVLKKLMAGGGDISQKDRKGRSALDLFEEQKLKHNYGKVCKKCVKVQVVLNEKIFPGGSAGTKEQKHDVLFKAGPSVVF